jgi:hypothetical protein
MHSVNIFYSANDPGKAKEFFLTIRVAMILNYIIKLQFVIYMHREFHGMVIEKEEKSLDLIILL